MNIEREFPLHVAVWNNDTIKLEELIRNNKVSYFYFIDLISKIRILLMKLFLIDVELVTKFHISRD